MVLKTKAYIIDREKGCIEEKKENDDYEKYVEELLENIEKSKGLTQYMSENPTIGVLSSVMQSVENSLYEIGEKEEATIARNFSAIAVRFLAKESAAQEKIEQMGTIIKVGCLVQAIIKTAEGFQYLIAKADSTDYLNNVDLKRNRGIEISKKRLGKSCLIDIKKGADSAMEIKQIRVLLDNKAVYFYKEFLEVIPIHRDDDNTEKMMAVVLKCIDKGLKSTYPKQRLLLRNAFIHHVKSNNFINYETICTDVFNNYLDSDECEIPIEDREKLKQKLADLPEKRNFSPQFNKVPSKVKARILQSEYSLNKGIQLIISDIDQEELLNNIQSGSERGGRQYIKVYTNDEEAVAAFAPDILEEGIAACHYEETQV